MKTPQELLKERKERIRKAVALEKTDRTPVVTLADGFCATHMGVKLSEFCSSLKASNKVMVESIRDMGPGFILASGCAVPVNAKIENVKAMIAAATGK
ncbi:hypothetical protein SPSIL_006060 [Sporomusa silvacetica DSM 10669]|uniref:Uroporphyrinogen decarboxylase (URO-D) domain-containing protein n=1 Tax=Sporomusa silvacetica DSM 10669 TaxID=1123289 RepID=A0ABZ3IFN9_9FIRM|nr:hypothetical protein [Sporomusa silvacetica]OZC17068.1 uroporphyrinogen decarboxylase UroD [Sporomusa silvacetica DSM 10669]